MWRVRERLEREKREKMKIEDLKVGRVYRAKRPRVVHTLGGSYINDRQILYISPFEETIQYDSPKVGFGSRYPVISVCRQTRSSSLKSWGYSTKCRHISALSLHTKDATVN